MVNRFPTSFYWTGLWLVVVTASLYIRPPLPVDETRYLAVAWEMWLRSDFLVPYLNGETYSHKPPLLFWLMHISWAAFGVNDLTPRLVAPLFGLACLFLTRSVARDLWPDDRRVHDMAPILLLGCCFWALFSTVTMFDLMLALCALLGLKGILMALSRRDRRGFVVLGLAIGLGALTKGPAILVHLLPVALLAPLWARYLANGDNANPKSWWGWYVGVFLAVVLGVAIGLAWAIPAGIAGGEEYRNAILWGQTAGRMVKSFAHQRPFWWYLAVLPGLVLPWLIWPPLWRTVQTLKETIRFEGGLRLCLIWFGTAFIVFSLISGKQLHYLLPEFPAIALVMAYGLCNSNWSEGGYWSRHLPGLFAVVIGLAISIVPVLGVIPRPPEWLSLIDNWWGLVIVGVGIWAMIGRYSVPEPRVNKLAAISIFTVVAIHLALAPVLKAVYDLRPFAQQLKVWEDQGIPLANFGKYHGQYQYLGRLTKPMAIMGQKEGDEEAFLQNNPGGYIVAYYRNVPTVAKPLHTYTFRRITIAVWDAKTMLANPHMGDRR
jgi:4-amino-4-deoxy-L-arabinose transferase-like glycosyltransferase